MGRLQVPEVAIERARTGPDPGTRRPPRVGYDQRMLRPAAPARRGSRVATLALVVAAVSAACGANASPVATGAPPLGASAAPSPAASGPVPTPAPFVSSAAAPTARPSAVAPTLKSFWTAVARGLTTAKRLEVTVSGPNPGVLRFEPAASATIVAGQVAFVCVGGAAFDGQSGFARVPGAWKCGADALVSGFRLIGQPADSWSATSPTDAAITESVKAAADGTWTWAYRGISAFLGGAVTARVSLDTRTGRILAARRTDPTGTTTYTFDYEVTFPALAVPH